MNDGVPPSEDLSAARIRILNVLYDERLGGPQWRVAMVARGLRARGIDTTVAMPKGDRSAAPTFQANGVPCHQIHLHRLREPKNVLGNLLWLADLWPSVMRLAALVTSQRIDVIHSNGINIQAALAARVARVPIVWHLNDVNTPRFVVKTLTPIIRLTATRVAVSSQAAARHFGQCDNGAHPALLYAPVDTSRFEAADLPRSTASNGDGTGSPRRRVGNVANLNPFKGQDHLIRAFAEVAGSNPEAELVLVGAPLDNRKEYADKLSEEAKALGIGSKVHFLGSRQDVPGIMSSLTVYAHPSLTEACPMTVLEAMACSRAIVATKVGGLPELIDDGHSGVLVPPADPHAMATAILKLLDDEGARERMGRAARETAVNKFSLEAAVDAHEALYRSVYGHE